MCSDSFVYPPRDEIRDELVEESDFSVEEADILHWDTLYETYGRIVRYNEEGVEAEIRAKDWFKEAIAD